MRFLFLVWLVIEGLQLVLIGMLVVGYRNLQRRLDEGAYRFSTHPPPSVTDDGGTKELSGSYIATSDSS
ncbi:MAG: hypothetical protein ACREBG_05145 [Pyrinomonadaceae bacterium]